MASHHENNAKGVSPISVDGPCEDSKVSKLAVSYPQPITMDGPNEDQKFSKAPEGPGTGSIEVDGPNTPNPMSNTGDH
jgi:hypothetical protein